MDKNHHRKWLKCMARYAMDQNKVEEIKELRTQEIQTRELWNLVTMQIRVKLLTTPESSENGLYAKYSSLNQQLNDIFNDMDYLPFFQAPTKLLPTKYQILTALAEKVVKHDIKP